MEKTLCFLHSYIYIASTIAAIPVPNPPNRVKTNTIDHIVLVLRCGHPNDSPTLSETADINAVNAEIPASSSSTIVIIIRVTSIIVSLVF